MCHDSIKRANKADSEFQMKLKKDRKEEGEKENPMYSLGIEKVPRLFRHFRIIGYA